jgi:signal transduction histidine kinase
LNLLINARDATSGKGSIWLSTEKKGDGVMLTVRDDGHGMTESVKNNIFTPFFTTKEKGLGTGLGLYIVQEIVKEHDGSIELDSSEGEGTTFRLYLPSH